MAQKRFNVDALTKVFKKIVSNFATSDDLASTEDKIESQLDKIDSRIDGIISEGGEPNIIDTVQQNGVDLPVTNKTVNVTVPTKVSELENDADYATVNEIPTKVSELENDADYAAESEIPTKTSELENDSGYITKDDIPEGEVVNPNILRGTNYAVLGDGKWENGSWNYGEEYGTAPTAIKITDPPVEGINEGWKGLNSAQSIAQNYIPTESGKTDTASVYARGNGEIYIGVMAGSYSFDVDSDDWVLYKKSFTANSSDFIGFGASNDSIEICGMKLEEGDTATPWCLSQFDTENKYVYNSIVDNCVTDNADLPLSAAQGKVLMDELTQVKSDLSELSDTWFTEGTSLAEGTDLNDVTTPGKYYTDNAGVTNSLLNCPASAHAIGLWVVQLTRLRTVQIIVANNVTTIYIRADVEYSWYQVTSNIVS